MEQVLVRQLGKSCAIYYKKDIGIYVLAAIAMGVLLIRFLVGCLGEIRHPTADTLLMACGGGVCVMLLISLVKLIIAGGSERLVADEAGVFLLNSKEGRISWTEIDGFDVTGFSARGINSGRARLVVIVNDDCLKKIPNDIALNNSDGRKQGAMMQYLTLAIGETPSIEKLKAELLTSSMFCKSPV